MGTPQECDLGRRRLLLAGAAALFKAREIPALTTSIMAAAIETACRVQAEQTLGPEFPPIRERKIPGEGDIVLIEGAPFLLGRNKRYPMPSTYPKNSKLERYGGRIIAVGGEQFARYPIVDPSKQLTIVESVVNLHPNIEERDMVREMISKKLHSGGEMLLFYPGFLNDDGEPFNPFLPRVDTFTTFIRGLSSKDWQFWDSLFFNYGEDVWLDRYDIKNTMRDPRENIKHSKIFLASLKEELPLIRFNVIAHSLGCIFALTAAVEHPEKVNNLVLINGPLKGLEKTAGRVVEVSALKGMTAPLGGEKVTDYLFGLWENKAYQKWLGDAVRFLRSIGVGVTVIVDEGDGIVPPESAFVEEAETLTIRTGEKKGLLPDYKEGLKNHGRPLKYRAAIDYIAERIGQDLADAA